MFSKTPRLGLSILEPSSVAPFESTNAVLNFLDKAAGVKSAESQESA